MKIREQLAHPPDRLYHSTSILILGKPGSGKTRLASTVGRASFNEPSPLLVIDQDNGAGGQRFLNPALLPESFKDYASIFTNVLDAVKRQEPPYTMKMLGREWKFTGLLIDTLNRMQDILKKDIKGGYLSGKRLQIQDYGSMLDDLLGSILLLKEISESKPFHLVLTAQIAPDKISLRQSKKDSDDLAGAYYWLPSLMGSVAPKLPEHVDIVVTTYRNPSTRQWCVYGEDTITDVGTFAGKLRYLDFFRGKPDNLPGSWWEILKAHGVNVDQPQSIGKLDRLEAVEGHWSEDESARVKIEETLTKYGVPLEALFRGNGAEDWADLESVKTGKEAIAKARQWWEANKLDEEELSPELQEALNSDGGY